MKLHTWFLDLSTSQAHQGGVEPHFYRLNSVLRGQFTQKAESKEKRNSTLGFIDFSISLAHQGGVEPHFFLLIPFFRG